MTDSEVKEIQFQKGATVVVQNSINQGFFYIIRSGTLQVDSEHKFSDKVLSRFEAGDSFGLVSALTGHRFLVTIFASTPATVLRVPLPMLGSFLKNKKSIAMKMLSLYSRELRALHKHLSQVNIPDERENHPRRLLANANTYKEWGNPRLSSYALSRFLEWTEKENETENIEEAKTLLASLPKKYTGPNWEKHIKQLEKNEVLFLENEISSDVYVIETGTVKLFSIVRGHEFVIDVLEAGEIFGEMSLIDQAPRMASAMTDSPCEILRLTPENLLDFVGEQVLQKIFESLARRIWFSHQRLIILRIPDPVTRIYAFLYNLIRDQLLKKGKNPEAHLRDSFEFKVAFNELKIMCGILKAKEDTLRPIIKDTNIEIKKDCIIIHDRKRVEEKVPYRTKTGQITAHVM